MLADQTQVDFVTLTPSAILAVKDLLAKRNLEGYALRVFVSGGGCSGIQYGMALEGKIREEDVSASFNGVQVVIDEMSIEYMRGATIDFVDDVNGSGFKIDNPNAVSSCNCQSDQNGCGCH
jgi:iron-sulfur cluster assembly accessory protein